MVIAWSTFFEVDFIATAPSDNIFVNRSEGGTKGSPISRRKWPKMTKFNFQTNGGKIEW